MLIKCECLMIFQFVIVWTANTILSTYRARRLHLLPYRRQIMAGIPPPSPTRADLPLIFVTARQHTGMHSLQNNRLFLDVQCYGLCLIIWLFAFDVLNGSLQLTETASSTHLHVVNEPQPEPFQSRLQDWICHSFVSKHGKVREY